MELESIEPSLGCWRELAALCWDLPSLPLSSRGLMAVNPASSVCDPLGVRIPSGGFVAWIRENKLKEFVCEIFVNQ